MKLQFFLRFCIQECLCIFVFIYLDVFIGNWKIPEAGSSKGKAAWWSPKSKQWKETHTCQASSGDSLIWFIEWSGCKKRDCRLWGEWKQGFWEKETQMV